ncbi:hypothetical protein [Hymenobacter sp. BT190]|uniref:hypothetical protein n=1 Tax=Hymenobacter sp. BT190 TaxID=2763505 RepID=UPI001650D78D|nr:hypothetical protein [Hymenobacter sp. BT190]MBC6698878.1 hypothetical protein [Hymenobacter sp. BT190]
METPAPLRLKDALALLEGEAPVSVRFVKANRRTGEAGAFGTLPAARIGRGKRIKTATFRLTTPEEDAAAGIDESQVPLPLPRNPHHWTNATRNLVDTRTGKLVKVHIYLIVAVQGRKIFL